MLSKQKVEAVSNADFSPIPPPIPHYRREERERGANLL